MSSSMPQAPSPDSLPNASGSGSGDLGVEPLDGARRFVDDVRTWLKRTGTSMRQLAVDAEVDPGQLCRALKGKTPPTDRMKQKVGHVIGATAVTFGQWAGFRRQAPTAPRR